MIWILAPLLAVGTVCWASLYLPVRLQIAVGLLLALAGPGIVLYTEWFYSTEHTFPVKDMPVMLDERAPIHTQPFELALSGPFVVNMDFDTGLPRDEMNCLIGSGVLDFLCYDRPPALNIVWTVHDGAEVVARGSTIADWMKKNSFYKPGQAARERADYYAYEKNHPQPAFLPPHAGWRPSVEFGYFQGVKGHRYRVDVDVRGPVGVLANMHPRLSVFLSGTKADIGLWLFVLYAAAVCVICGLALAIAGWRSLRHRSRPPLFGARA